MGAAGAAGQRNANTHSTHSREQPGPKNGSGELAASHRTEQPRNQNSLNNRARLDDNISNQRGSEFPRTDRTDLRAAWDADCNVALWDGFQVGVRVGIHRVVILQAFDSLVHPSGFENGDRR